MRLSTRPYTLKEVSAIYNISVTTLRYRCYAQKIKPTRLNRKYRFYLTSNQVFDVIEKPSNRQLTSEIIYVHTTWLVLESKMNKK